MTQGTRHAVVTVLGIVALLAVVAVAATGSAPTGPRGANDPSQWALDVIVSLMMVVFALGSVLIVLVIVLRPQWLLDVASARERRRGSMLSIVGVGIAAVLFVLAVRRLAGDDTGVDDPTGGLSGAPGADVPQRDDVYEPSFALVPVLVALAVLTVGAVAAALAFRSRRRYADGDGEDVSVAVGDALDEALDDLRAEVDARRAVIAAYARLERVLAAYGIPRRPSEAPEEYLERVLPTLEVSQYAVARLTTLFATAKFSQHDVGVRMKDEAIDALETARDELRLAAARKQAEREAALAHARERAAG